MLRRLAWTSFVSNIGSALQGIAFGYLAYARWGRAIAPVLVISAYTVAYAAISLPAGRWAQVRDRRRVAIASNLAKVVQCSRGSSTAPTTTPLASRAQRTHSRGRRDDADHGPAAPRHPPG